MLKKFILSSIDVPAAASSGCGTALLPTGQGLSSVTLIMRPRAGRLGAYTQTNQPAQADQIVDGLRETHDPRDPLPPSVAEVAQQADRLAPAEALFDQLPLPLTLPVAGMPRGAGIERAGWLGCMDIRRDMWRDVQGAERRDDGGLVIALVRAERAAALARRQRGEQLDRRLPFGVIAGGPHVGGDDEPVPVAMSTLAW
jgi:hypothetical protein